MFEFDQDFALDSSEYSHEAQQTHNRAIEEVHFERCEFLRAFLSRGANINLINEEEEIRDENYGSDGFTRWMLDVRWRDARGRARGKGAPRQFPVA
jgi:hypothetical protein